MRRGQGLGTMFLRPVPMARSSLHQPIEVHAARCSTGTRQLESGAWKWPLDFKIQNSSRFIFFYLPHRGVPQVPGVSDLQVRSCCFLVNLVER